MKTIYSLALITSILPNLASAEVLKLKALYHVPMGEKSSLESFASFLIAPYEVDTAPVGKEVVQFQLPSDLVGEQPVQITLVVQEKVETTRKLSGPLGDAVCVGPWVNMSCEFRFKNLPIRETQVNQYLKTKYSGAELSARKLVALQFGSDPIGTAVIARELP